MERILMDSRSAVTSNFTQVFPVYIGPNLPQCTQSLSLWEIALRESDPFIHFGSKYQDWLDRRHTLRFLRSSGMSEGRIIPYFLRSLEVQEWD